MNKKVSTLLTCGLMLGGSLLSSSAFAEQFSEVPDGGGTYALKSTYYYNVNSWSSQAEGAGKYVAYNAAEKEFYLTSEASLKATFSVSKNEAGTSITYTIKLADGTPFSFGTNGTDTYTVSLRNADNNADTYDGEILEWGATTKYQVASEGGNDAPLRAHAANSGENDGYYPLLFELEEVTPSEAGDLNDLYNKKGFNLSAGADVEGNLFGGSTRIISHKVSDDYSLSSIQNNGKELIIPAGLYFFTDLELLDATQGVSDANIDWLASTVIAVSPTETVEGTVNDRDEGQGFKLIELNLGAENVVFKNNTSDYVVGEMPIENACFEAMDNQAGKYAIRLNEFYYKVNENDANGTALSDPTQVDLVVLDFTDGTKVLSTTPAGDAYDYIFTLSYSGVKNGVDLLNTERKAAVYNIRFVGGNSSLQGKYLTSGVATNDNEVAVNNADFKWVAKGSDIANLSYPSFQYTITAVDKANASDTTYVNVTFTNRETNESFTAQLFPEEGGANYYSLAFVNNNEIDNVTPVDVKRNNYGVEAAAPVSFNENLIVELIPSEVNEYAGFLNVDNKSVRTIRFARDKFVTSDDWYVAVTTDTNGDYTLNAGSDDYFVEDAYDAAQFQLVKSDKPSTIARTYVYNAGTGSVNDVANGDKVSAYTYKLQYLNDGTETGWYLGDDNGVKMEEKTAETAKEFYIKENADGSVSLFGPANAFSTADENGQRVTIPTKNVSMDAEMNSTDDYPSYLKYDNNAEHRSAIYAYTSSDLNLKTYLDDEIDNLSWTEAGHVTLKNGTEGVAGNYISMNESNEAVVTDEADETLYLHKTDETAVVPSFYISKGIGEENRMFLFNPMDSVSYNETLQYDPKYQVAKAKTKAIFKAGILDASCDTMTITVKGEVRQIAQNSDNDGTWAGLDRFKWQIIETADADGYYNIRQVGGYTADKGATYTTGYLASQNEKLYISNEKSDAMAIFVDPVAAPTANESVSATEVKVIATDGAINIKNAAGKNVVISTILGQIVANEVLTSDNATISVPNGIAIVSVDGEEAVKVSVR